MEQAESVIDQNTFENLKQTVGAEFLDELIVTFNEDSPKLIAEMRQALAEANAEQLRRAAHSLKSNSANFGATNLSASAKELELMGKAGTLTGAAEKVESLEAEFRRVERALKALQNGS